MSLTVHDLVTLPALAAAAPQIVSGSPGRAVRWVHTSEIFDIATLLKGGEALLTSGLGLVGANEARLRAYARSLREIDVGALLFEVGRTFSEVPPVIIDELSESPVALVRLDGVVPFIDITEAAHRLILDAESMSLRASDRATTRFMEVLLNGGGVAAILGSIEELTGAPAAFIDSQGREIAATGTVPQNARELERPVEVFGERRGSIRSAAAVTADNRIIIDRGAAAMALELTRSGPTMPTRRYAHEQMLQSLLSADISVTELEARGRSLGIVIGPTSTVVAVACTVAPGRGIDDGYVHLMDAVPREFGPSIIGRVGHSITFVCALDSSQQVDVVRSRLTRATTTPGGLFRSVTAGEIVETWADVPSSLRAALDAAALAPLLGANAVMLAEDTALFRLLQSVDGTGALDDFVTAQLGAVLEFDARRGSDLLHTLIELFRAGGSRAAAARALSIRRQTLYDRIERLESLLGAGVLSDPARTITLHVATLAWTMTTRTARVPVALPGRAARSGYSTASKLR